MMKVTMSGARHQAQDCMMMEQNMEFMEGVTVKVGGGVALYIYIFF